MSKKVLYTDLKTDLLTISTTKANGNTMRYKTVQLWRNNLENENIEQPFLKPACFIEFLPSNYTELSLGVQQYDMIVRLHCVFESYLDEDTDILELIEATFAKVQLKQYSTFSKLLRRQETQDFDHDNVQDYMQDFTTIGRDYRADTRATTEVLVAPVVTATVI